MCDRGNQLLAFFDLRVAFLAFALASPFGGSSPALRFVPAAAVFFTLTTVDLPAFATCVSAAAQSADASSIAYLEADDHGARAGLVSVELGGQEGAAGAYRLMSRELIISRCFSRRAFVTSSPAASSSSAIVSSTGRQSAAGCDAIGPDGAAGAGSDALMASR
jgi:hypothetical protein